MRQTAAVRLPAHGLAAPPFAKASGGAAVFGGADGQEMASRRGGLAQGTPTLRYSPTGRLEVCPYHAGRWGLVRPGKVREAGGEWKGVHEGTYGAGRREGKGMKLKVHPQEERFFELFEEAAKNVAKGAELLVELVEASRPRRGAAPRDRGGRARGRHHHPRDRRPAEPHLRHALRPRGHPRPGRAAGRHPGQHRGHRRPHVPLRGRRADRGDGEPGGGAGRGDQGGASAPWAACGT